MKKLIALVSPILITFTICHTNITLSYAKGLLIGSIQFPASLTSIPELRVYRGGNKVACETHEAAKKISFAIPEDKTRTQFSLVITVPPSNIKKEQQFKSVKDTNVIEYLTVQPKQTYKFYCLELLAFEEDEENITHRWIIKEQKNGLVGGRIPDDAIIVYYKPEWIGSVEGGTVNGNVIELPKIMIKENIIQLAGSAIKLKETSESILISAMDLDAIHSTFKKEILQNKLCTRITILT
ncbi:MAG: hypothetical protein NTX86_05860 [Candidatus Dependentiae bacterium]|nr:hypothetical protein [Candidatus Dependentiae bacterium]